MDSLARKYYVYVLIHPWSGVPCYVGKGHGDRLVRHAKRGVRHSNERLSRIYAKCERLGLTMQSDILCENLTNSEAYYIERAFIQLYGRGRGSDCLVNFTDGGEGLRNPTQDVRNRMKKGIVARWADPVERAKSIARLRGNTYFLGRKHSPETKAKMAAYAYGRPVSSETREKIAATKRGKSLTDAHRQKLRDAWARRKALR